MTLHILIVEDRPDAGKFLKQHLEMRGFRVSLVPTYDAAMAFIDAHPEPPDVAILDMDLGPGKTGAEVGKQLLRRYRKAPPEQIFYTAFNDDHFWEAAVRLTIAIYLLKSGAGYTDVITHSRVLSARRRVSLFPVNQHHRLQEIVHSGGGRSHIYKTVVQHAIDATFKEALGLDYFLLLSLGGSHYAVGGNLADIPQTHEFYDQLQNETAQLASGEFLEPRSLPPDIYSKDKQFQVTMVPLYNEDIILSIGLVEDPEHEAPMQERSEPMARTMCRHLRAQWLERLFSQTEQLIREKEGRQEQVKVTSSLCRGLGRYHGELYSEASRLGEINANHFVLPRFKTLGDRLEKLGAQLNMIQTEGAPSVPVDFSAQVEDIWQELVNKRRLPSGALQCEKGIQVMGNRSDLRMALRKIFGWYSSRFSEDESSAIIIRARMSGPYCYLEIQDNSERLADDMLRNLFRPFSNSIPSDDGIEDWTGLFIAKMLIHERLGGRLTERSKDLAQPHGHLLEIRLNRVEGAAS